jgi:hypothetical protein
VELETEPELPDEVVRSLEAALAAEAPAPDPWWQAGLDEALGE